MDMKYFLNYDFGSCNDGDHYSGLEEFDTLEELHQWVKDHLNEGLMGLYDPTPIIIYGRRIHRNDNPITLAVKKD